MILDESNPGAALAHKLGGAYVVAKRAIEDWAAESCAEYLANKVIWTSLEHFFEYVDPENFPAGQFIDFDMPRYIPAAKQYKYHYKPDNILQLRKRELGKRKPQGLDVVFPDVYASNEDVEECIQECGVMSRLLVEFQAELNAPRPPLDNPSANEIINGHIVDYMNSSEFFSPNNDPVSQSVTYACVTRTRIFIICTFNRALYGMVDITDDGKVNVKCTEWFQWCPSSPNGEDGKFPLTSRPDWSHWEILLRALLANVGRWYQPRIPDVLKVRFKNSIETKQKQKSHSGKEMEGYAPKEQDKSTLGSSSTMMAAAQLRFNDEVLQMERTAKEEKPTSGSFTTMTAAAQFRTKDEVLQMERTAKETTGFVFDPLFWEDLFDPIRFAIPAIDFKLEATDNHLAGDAEIIGYGQWGPIFRKILQGRDAVVKALVHNVQRDELDDGRFEEMRNELKIYRKCRNLQGNVIPTLLWYGEIVQGSTDCLVTEWVGENLDDEKLLNKALANGARNALRALHECGVVHNDVALRNFTCLNDNVFIIDFGLSSLREDYQVDDWKRMCEKEMQELEFCIKSYMVCDEPLGVKENI